MYSATRHYARGCLDDASLAIAAHVDYPCSGDEAGDE